MFDGYLVAFLLIVLWSVEVIDASAGDADPHYRYFSSNLFFVFL